MPLQRPAALCVSAGCDTALTPLHAPYHDYVIRPLGWSAACLEPAVEKTRP